MVFKVLYYVCELAEAVMFGSLRGMTALIGNGDFIIAIALFCHTDADYISIYKVLYVTCEYRAALVDNAVEVYTSLFKGFNYCACAGLA